VYFFALRDHKLNIEKKRKEKSGGSGEIKFSRLAIEDGIRSSVAGDDGLGRQGSGGNDFGRNGLCDLLRNTARLLAKAAASPGRDRRRGRGGRCGGG